MWSRPEGPLTYDIEDLQSKFEMSLNKPADGRVLRESDEWVKKRST